MARITCHIVSDKREGMNLEEAVAEAGDTGGYLNPRWIEWLMGFPHRWSEALSVPSATPSSPKSQSSSVTN